MRAVRRDHRGRFANLADEVFSIFDLLLLAFKVIIIAILFYMFYHYFGFAESLKKFLINFLFGEGCKLECPKKDNGGYF